jgi:hypothetical protein
MAIDEDVLIRSGATDLTASVTGATGVDFGGHDQALVTYLVHVPKADGTSPTLDVKIQVSDNNSDWRDYLTFPQITAAGQYFLSGQATERYRRYYATVGGSDPDFGGVIIAPVPAGRDINW